MRKSVLERDHKIEALAEKCRENSMIDPSYYGMYDVKRGLRDINGLGVVAGLTKILASPSL